MTGISEYERCGMPFRFDDTDDNANKRYSKWVVTLLKVSLFTSIYDDSKHL